MYVDCVTTFPVLSVSTLVALMLFSIFQNVNFASSFLVILRMIPSGKKMCRIIRMLSFHFVSYVTIPLASTVPTQCTKTAKMNRFHYFFFNRRDILKIMNFFYGITVNFYGNLYGFTRASKFVYSNLSAGVIFSKDFARCVCLQYVVHSIHSSPFQRLFLF